MFHPSGHWTKCHLAFLDIPDPSDLFILPGSLIYSTHTLLEDLLRSMHPAQHWGGKNISREKAGGSTKDCCGPTSGQLPGRGVSSGQVGSAPAGRRNRCWCSRQGEVGWGGEAMLTRSRGGKKLLPQAASYHPLARTSLETPAGGSLCPDPIRNALGCKEQNTWLSGLQ